MNEWWGGQPDGLKQAFSLFPDGRWKEADLYLRINIRNYCLLKKGGLLPEDKDRSMLSEIVCELADMIRYMGSLVQPTIAVITNVGDAHIENLGGTRRVP